MGIASLLGRRRSAAAFSSEKHQTGKIGDQATVGVVARERGLRLITKAGNCRRFEEPGNGIARRDCLGDHHAGVRWSNRRSCWPEISVSQDLQATKPGTTLGINVPEANFFGGLIHGFAAYELELQLIGCAYAPTWTIPLAPPPSKMAKMGFVPERTSDTFSPRLSLIQFNHCITIEDPRQQIRSSSAHMSQRRDAPAIR